MKTLLIRTRVISFVSILLLGLFGALLAQGAVSDDFQSYTNDAALTATWARVSGTDATIFLAPDPTDGGNQTIEQTTAAGRLRQTIVGIVPTDANPLVFSFDLYDTTGATASGRVYGEIRNSASAGGLFAAGIYNSVTTGTYDVSKFQARNLDNGAWIQLDAPRSVGWHNFRFELFGNTANLYVDNVLDPYFSGLSYSGAVTYDWLHVGSALTGNTAAYFDNVMLMVVPEPSVFALAGLGVLGFALFAWRRRRAQ